MTKRLAPTGDGKSASLGGGPNEARAMTDTTKPNDDRDRHSDREAAKNPRGLAIGPPEGTASSGSTSPPLDMALLRELAKEFGYWPAGTHEDDTERHRRDNAADKARHEAYCGSTGREVPSTINGTT